MARFSVTSILRFRIVSMRRQGFKVSAITKRLREERIYVSRQTIHTIVKRFEKEGSIAYKSRKVVSKIRIEHMDFIDKAYEEDDELTAADLQKKLSSTFNLNLSLTTIKKVRRRLG